MEREPRRGFRQRGRADRRGATRSRERGVDVVSIEGLAGIPPFRADLVDDAPDAVAAFRVAVESVDGLLVAAPEYAGGVAGVVKNALDWLVGSGSLYHRVVGVLSAGTTGGTFAIEQLVRTISWQGGLVVTTLADRRRRARSRTRRGVFTDAVDARRDRRLGGRRRRPRSGSRRRHRLARVAPIVAPLGIDVARFGDVA